MKIIANKTSPIENKTCLCNPDAYENSSAIAVVKKRADFNKLGILTEFPDIIIIAIVSPNARPNPRNTADRISFLDAGMTTLNIDLAFDSPNAKDASKNLFDANLMQLWDILIIVGNIIIDKIIMAERRQSPVVYL